MSLSVSIVLYKTPLTDIEKCLNSLKYYRGVIQLHVIDNSPDDSLKIVQNLFPNTLYTHLPDNPGYGTAHNIAIKQFQIENFEYHLIINADVNFEGDVLLNIIDYMNTDEKIGHVMPKVLYPNGELQYLCKLIPSPFNLLFHRLLPINHKFNQVFHFKDSGYNKIMFVPYLSGCFMLIKHKVLKEVGLFDERFFMYPEDIDLTRRIAEKFDTIYFPEVTVFHNHGKASHQSFKMLVIHIVNLIKYFNKWGWIFDNKRKQINAKALKRLQLTTI